MSIKRALKLINKYAGVPRSQKKRGLVCIDAEHEKNSSNLDKFPINKPSEARKALIRVKSFTKAPKWWKGSLDELKTLVKSTIEKNYKIEMKGDEIIVSTKSS